MAMPRSALAAGGMLVPELLGIEGIGRPGNAGDDGEGDPERIGGLSWLILQFGGGDTYRRPGLGGDDAPLP
jgi:hypothetical protein